MGIFAQNQRTIHVIRKCVITDFVHPHVHRTIYIGMRLCTSLLELNKTGRISFFQPVIPVSEYTSVPTFISQRPDNDGRMIFIPFEHPENTVMMYLFP